MDILIDHKLRISQHTINRHPAIWAWIRNALEIPNMERQKAMEQGLWGWQNLPETIALWTYDRSSNYVLMPRGFLADLVTYLDVAHAHLDWDLVDNRQTFTHDIPWTPAIQLHEWQEPAVEAILSRQQGIWKAPAGSGKTVGVLEAIRRHAGRAIVIVNTKDIMWQWQKRAAHFLGEEFPVGQMGDGKLMTSEFLTIATVQTLHKHFASLWHEGFFEYFSFMCLDECHHATAETFNKVVDEFSAEIRIGVSATPDKTGDFALATSVLGPIIHETHPHKVDTLIKPDVYKIPTHFSFNYQERKGARPSNYPALVQALVENHARNWLIVKSIMIEQEGHCLVISKRLEHLDTLKRLLRFAGYKYQILTLTGKETNDERQRVVEAAQVQPCCIFSTLADEALDIPRLDRLFLVFPQRNAGLITQQVGRVERKCDGKEDAKIFDFCDPHVGPLDNQWKVRKREVYNKRNYHVQTATADHIESYQIG